MLRYDPFPPHHQLADHGAHHGHGRAVQAAHERVQDAEQQDGAAQHAAFAMRSAMTR